MSNTQADIEQELNSLWVHAQFGDALCYRQLLSELGHVLRIFLQHLMPDQLNEVEDLLQACLLAAHLKRHTYQGKGWITNWLYDICVFKWTFHQRQRGRSTRSMTSFNQWEEIQLHQHAHANYASNLDLGRLSGLLKPKQRLALELAKLGDSSVMTNKSAQHIHERDLHTALQNLHNHWRG